MICIALVACHEDLKERAMREAREFTRKNCPQRLQGGLTCDSMVFEANDSTLHYYYTVEGKIDDKNVMAFYATKLRDGLLENIRNDVTSRTFKEAGFNYGVTIHSAKNKGQKLYEVRYTKKDYLSPTKK